MAMASLPVLVLCCLGLVLHPVVADEYVPCPDGQSYCPDGNTCCRMLDGSWGCCPMPLAVCCADRLHCCPRGSTCNAQTGKCQRENGLEIDWTNKIPSSRLAGSSKVKKPLPEAPLQSLPAAQGSRPEESSLAAAEHVEENYLLCSDGKSTCADGNTCCLMPNHQWVCCQYYMAVCCSDGFHCCPYGNICDLPHNRCIPRDSVATWLNLVVTKKSAQQKLK